MRFFRSCVPYTCGGLSVVELSWEERSEPPGAWSDAGGIQSSTIINVSTSFGCSRGSNGVSLTLTFDIVELKWISKQLVPFWSEELSECCVTSDCSEYLPF